MDQALKYVIQTIKDLETGNLPDFPDPGDPPDLGAPLTTDEIDFLKTFIKEVKERYGAL